MNIANIIHNICVSAIPMVLAVTVHESAHGYVAEKNGDPTARNLGRLTLNPLPHIDLIGTIVLPLILLGINAPFLFGWAKPVPVNFRRMKNFRKGMRQVAAAGPFSNLLMMLIWAFLYVLTESFLQSEGSTFVSFVYEMSGFGMMINAILCIFNLIPIPPLDGSRVLDSYLSPAASAKYTQLEPYGTWIILAGLSLGFFRMLGPVVYWLLGSTLELLRTLVHTLI